MRRKFTIRRYLHSIILGAHPGAHETFDDTMLSYYTGEALEGKMGFRPVTFDELMSADKEIWNRIWTPIDPGE